MSLDSVLTLILTELAYHTFNDDDFGSYVSLDIENVHKVNEEHAQRATVENTCPHKVLAVQCAPQDYGSYKQHIQQRVKIRPRTFEVVRNFGKDILRLLNHYLQV